MTGFGSSVGQADGFRWTIEVRSVNARGLDIRTRLPDGIEGLERTVRDRIAKAIKRGNVSVNIRLSRDEDSINLTPDKARIDAALEAIAAVENAAVARGQSLSKTRAVDVLALRGVMESGRDQGIPANVQKAIITDFETALGEFCDMRAGEGRKIAALLSDQIAEVDRLTGLSETAAGKRADRMRDALDAALAAILGSTDKVDPGRVEAELAVVAVKADVTEEIDRLRTHVAAARDLLAGDDPVGRRLDFLSQEFNREANTLCSKAQSAELTALGLDLKTVIDQMREQVQNVE